MAYVLRDECNRRIKPSTKDWTAVSEWGQEENEGCSTAMPLGTAQPDLKNGATREESHTTNTPALD